MKRNTALLVLALPLLLSACGGVAEIDTTVATLAPVRGQTRLGDEDAPPIARAAAGQAIRTGEHALARLALDDGPELLLGAQTELSPIDAQSLRLTAGRAFVQVEPGDVVAIETERGSLRASDAAISLRIEGESAHAYVVRGEVSYASGEHRGVASAGEELVLSQGEPSKSNATLWQDWTGGLARPGPADASVPVGMGSLEARVPDEIGLARWPLVIRRLDVRVRIDGDLAVTEVDQLFFNPASETVEGLYRVRVPEDAVLQRFAVDRDDQLVDGYVRERAQARQAYEVQVYRGSTEDPALLEWDAPGSYRARIYPIAAGETRRIVIRYAEWLRAPAEGAPRLYRYPMGGGARAPHVQELSLSADVAGSGAERVRAGMGAQVEEGAVRIRRSDFRPRADFWMELVGGQSPAQRAWTAEHAPPPRAPDAPAMANEADERDYFYLPLILPISVLGEGERATGPLDLVVVADVSAATDRSHLELGRSVVESLSAQLGPEDRVAVVTSDLTLRSLEGDRPALGVASPARVDGLLDGLARAPAGGATDLGAALTAAAGLLDPSRQGALIYVGDGAPTVGELGAEGLLQRLARLPSPVRLYAVGVGSDANLELLEAITRGAGLALRVEERAQAADAALRILGHASRPVAHQVEVDLGDGVDNVYPRRPMDAVIGDVFPIVGRVRGDLPSSVRVTMKIGGQSVEREIAIQAQATDEQTDLRLRWAGERLRQLLLTGAQREEVVELGTRYGLITPFTSYYVPSRRELGAMSDASWLIDRPLLTIARRDESNPTVTMLLGAALGPFALSGCSFADRSEPAPGTSSPVTAPEPARVELDGVPAQQAPGAPATGTFAPAPPAEPEAAEEAAPMARRMAAAEPTPTPVMPMPAAPAASANAAQPMDALGALAGDDQSGGDFGFGGLGLRGTGRGGGGSGEGTIGLGNLGNIGHGGGGGEGSGYGRGAESERSSSVPRVAGGRADVAGSLSADVIRRVVQRHVNEVRFCYEQQLMTQPELAGTVTVAFVIAPTGAVQSASVASTTLGSPAAESCIAQAVRRWTFPAPEGGGIVAVRYPFTLETPEHRAQAGTQVRITHVVFQGDAAAHRARRCSDAASLGLDDRKALWRERLGNEPSASGWVSQYRDAIRNCEAPDWRDRRAFLGLILARAGSIDAMVQVYRLLDEGSARGYLRSAILGRVRTPDDLRAVRYAFGLGRDPDWTLVEQVLARANDRAGRIRALRALVSQYPDSFELELRLLAELEEAGRRPEAIRLAEAMRADPMADAGVRTAIGELYLRLGRESDARRVFSEIVEFAPLDELARRRLGDLYRAHGWFEEAYRQYLTLSEIRPDDQEVLLLLAQAAGGAGRVDEALRLERTVMQTAQPGASQGLPRTALLWTSVRFARMRKAARDARDQERLTQLTSRMRSSGVLRDAGQLRVSLTWSHPDAQISLWASHPGLSLTRPTDITPELGIEAFDVAEQEDGTYRLEVRRGGDDRTTVRAQLVVVWNEGRQDEKVELVDLELGRGQRAFAWTLAGRTLAQATPSEAALRGGP